MMRRPASRWEYMRSHTSSSSADVSWWASEVGEWTLRPNIFTPLCWQRGCFGCWGGDVWLMMNINRWINTPGCPYTSWINQHLQGFFHCLNKIERYEFWVVFSLHIWRPLKMVSRLVVVTHYYNKPTCKTTKKSRTIYYSCGSQETEISFMKLNWAKMSKKYRALTLSVYKIP